MTLPTAPSRGDPPAVFIALANAFVAALPEFEEDMNGLAEDTAEYAAAVAADRVLTQLAADSVASAVDAFGTSTSTVSIGTGTKSFTIVENGRTFGLGQYAVAAVTASAATNYVLGRISGWNSGTKVLTVEVPAGGAGGSGSYSAWSIALTAPGGLPAATVANVRALSSNDVAVTPAGLAGSMAFASLTDAATIAWDMAAGFNRYVTLGGNRTMGQPTNPIDGEPIALALIQPSSGGPWSVSWHSVFDWRAGGPPTLSTGADKVDFAYGQFCSLIGKYIMHFSKAA